MIDLTKFIAAYLIVELFTASNEFMKHRTLKRHAIEALKVIMLKFNLILPYKDYKNHHKSLNKQHKLFY